MKDEIYCYDLESIKSRALSLLDRVEKVENIKKIVELGLFHGEELERIIVWLKKQNDMHADELRGIELLKNHLSFELALCSRCAAEMEDQLSQDGLCSYCKNNAEKESKR